MASGSLYQRADGYWVAALTVAGKRVVRYGKTKREAQERLAELQREHHAGQLARPTKVTVAAWVEEWLQQREGDLRPSTLRTYRLVLSAVMPHVGHVRLSRLTPADIAHALGLLRAAKMGSRRIQMAHAYLRAALSGAVTLGLLGYNPAEHVPSPKHEARQQPEWNAEQMKRWLTTALASNYRHAPLLAFLLGSGLRFGEAVGLRWGDVDVATGTVTVRRAIVWEGNSHASAQPPKTKHGYRTLSLPAYCLSLLAALPRPLNSDSAVFTSETGTTPAQSVVGTTMRKLSEQAGVPTIPVHGLRHCHAALLLSEGVDVQALRRRLGHARVDMTVNRYAYAVRADEEAAVLLERRLSEMKR